MHGPALQVIVQSVLDGMPLLPGEYTPADDDDSDAMFPTPEARMGSTGADPGRGGREHSGGEDLKTKVLGQFLPTPTTQDATNAGGPAQGRRRSPGLNYVAPVLAQRDELDPPGEQLLIPMPGDEQPGMDWGPFADAVARWVDVLGREAPPPLEDGPKGARLSVAFVEWLMGLPDGWVGDVYGVSYRQALIALGNGVVWQQAAAALQLMELDRENA